MFVARVTADVDALQQFMEWGGIAWIISAFQATGALVLMLVFSWQLALAVVVLMIPMVAIMGSMQARLSAAFNTARTRVGEMLSEVSESVMGAAVVRAYGLDDEAHARVERAVEARYKAEVVAHFRAQGYDPVGYTLYAYAAVQVWAQAVEAAGSLDLGKVTETMHSRQFNTVLGRIGFDEKGDVTGFDPWQWYVWQADGTYVALEQSAAKE